MYPKLREKYGQTILNIATLQSIVESLRFAWLDGNPCFGVSGTIVCSGAQELGLGVVGAPPGAACRLTRRVASRRSWWAGARSISTAGMSHRPAPVKEVGTCFSRKPSSEATALTGVDSTTCVSPAISPAATHSLSAKAKPRAPAEINRQWRHRVNI